MPRLVVYSDYVCPFSYLAEAGLARLRTEEGLEVEYRPFELRPAPAPLPDPADPALAESWERTILPLAETLGVEIRRPRVEPRSRKAHEAAAFAREKGVFPAMHDALFRAFFRDGRDIGRIDVLVELGVELGLDRTETRVVLDVDRYAPEVEAAELEAVRRGILGVPTFVAGDDELVGLQPYSVLRAWVRGESDDGT
ncbi:MAG TPA: DsbA family protein [Longimicrobiales bacterium]|nr:DsbA family protein [Longimicrobiales bacterium]